MSIENLGRVTKLLMMTSDKKNDRLRSFLTGWSALEIFLNKAFLFYEQEFISQGFTDNVSSGIKRYIERIKEAIKRGKYSLLDKFMMAAAFLGSDTIEADVELFRKLKDARDDFFHKQEIVDNNLPVAELRALLTRYLRAHIEFIKSPDR
jgi:phosphomannomutase